MVLSRPQRGAPPSKGPQRFVPVKLTLGQQLSSLFARVAGAQGILATPQPAGTMFPSQRLISAQGQAQIDLRNLGPQITNLQARILQQAAVPLQRGISESLMAGQEQLTAQQKALSLQQEAAQKEFTLFERKAKTIQETLTIQSESQDKMGQSSISPLAIAGILGAVFFFG